MKKILTILFFIYATSLAFAQEFYYYNGAKMTLQEIGNKYLTIVNNTNDDNTRNTYISSSNTIVIGNNTIQEYQIERGNKSLSQLKALIGVSENTYLLPCYSLGGLELAPNGYLDVKLFNANDSTKLTSVANLYRLSIVKRNKYMPLWYKLNITRETTLSIIDIANSIYETGEFASSSPSFHFEANEISYDPMVFQQWGLYNSQYDDIDISASRAWNYATGLGINIAIVDEGFDINHQDLSSNVTSSYDANADSIPCAKIGSHGTHCAGIAAALRNNNLHISGVAPDANLMLTNYAGGQSSDNEALANGINWAWKNGADVISCSWRTNPCDIIREAIDSAVTRGRNGKGCVFVKSAGNTGGSITFPGDYREEVISVANIQKNGVVNGSSSHGSNMFVIAPGTNIISTIPNNTVMYKTGTSMAAPHVAGLAALILERNPDLTNYEVREIIGTNTKKVGNMSYDMLKEFGTWNEYYGYGLVDAYESVINTPLLYNGY